MIEQTRQQVLGEFSSSRGSGESQCVNSLELLLRKGVQISILRSRTEK